MTTDTAGFASIDPAAWPNMKHHCAIHRHVRYQSITLALGHERQSVLIYCAACASVSYLERYGGTVETALFHTITAFPEGWQP